jgi:phosphoribosylaminoimidazole (AIR) synthetase
MDYREAGVDVEAGRAFVQRIRSMVDSTTRPEVLGNFGGFSGCFNCLVAIVNLCWCLAPMAWDEAQAGAESRSP